MNLRGLHGMVANRVSSENIALEYSVYIDALDGSAYGSSFVVLLKGSVGVLQPRDIERLEKAGIIVRNGVTIVIPECPEERPDRIVSGNKTYRVINWTFEFEYYLGSSAYGVVIATCDDMTIQNATVTGGSGS